MIIGGEINFELFFTIFFKGTLEGLLCKEIQHLFSVLRNFSLKILKPFFFFFEGTLEGFP